MSDEEVRFIDMQELMSVIKKDIESESERAIAIMFGVLIEELLKRQLSGVFLTGDTSKNVLKHTGALGTIDAKIKIAYCLELISKTEKTAIEKIQEIRNKFAHINQIDFSSPELSRKLDELALFMGHDLQHLNDQVEGEAKVKFLVCCTQVVMKLNTKRNLDDRGPATSR